jgi:hypothetical protein
VVVADEPFVSEQLHLLDRFEDVQIEHFVPIRSVEALDKRVLIWLARLDEQTLDPALSTPIARFPRLGPADFL